MVNVAWPLALATERMTGGAPLGLVMVPGERTVTTNDRVPLRGGVPLSVARRVTS